MDKLGDRKGLYLIYMDTIEHRLKNDFPNIDSKNHKITSDKTGEYNCIAWAAGDNEKWWWPAPSPFAYWPSEFPRVATIDNFINAFSSFGYEVCENQDLENDFEKIGLYADVDGNPTHMARQLENGFWTSKLGNDHDIEHVSLDTLVGPIYGNVLKILRRPKNK